MNDYEFILEDRIAKIRAINDQYDLEHNAYISFSGGKDSTILHYLIDMAIPNNNIPRLFLNTGIEYQLLRKYVKALAEKDKRIVMYNSGVNIKLCELYYPPYNFKRTGCKGCGFALDLQNQLDVMKKLLPKEYKQCEILWKPVYEEYRRIGYRLRKEPRAVQYTLDDYIKEDKDEA